MIDILLHVIRPLLAIIRGLSGMLLVCSVALNFGNIIARYFLHSSISWAEEVMLFLMVGCVFFGSGMVTWTGRHIRMDIFVRLMPEKAQVVLGLFSELAFLIAAIALFVFAWPVILQLVAFDQRSLAAELPLAIPQAAIPIGLAIMAFLLVARLITGRWNDLSGGSTH
jgi:TRAP-type C4-dicarboxylate transport system permease small subunit